MNVDVVVDVGNTRIKWGRCDANAVIEVVSVAPGDESLWTGLMAEWKLPSSAQWVVSGVHPTRRDQLVSWLQRRDQRVRLLESPQQVPLRTHLQHPERAGIDRLLNGVAANSCRSSGATAVIVDAGSAVTVDCLDVEGIFCGGAIFPGFRLMSQALHDYTALLPLVEVHQPPAWPGKTTTESMQGGIFWTIVGGIEKFLQHNSQQHSSRQEVFLTGGDAPLLASSLPESCRLWPEMTLEGIRLSALNSS